MRRRLILSGLAALAFAGQALASEGEGEKAPEPPYVDISPVGLPVVLDGRLVNYVFAQVRLNVRPGVDSGALRAKEPYFRDALIRAAHRTPFVLQDNPDRLDEAALKRVMAAEAARIAGPRAIVSVQVLRQTPRQRLAR